MVTIVKSEWHQLEKRYDIEIDEDMLSDIYPDDTEEEISQKLQDLVSGNLTVEQLEEDAIENNCWFDWNWLDEDDLWTDRKGGYEVTYEVSEGTTDEDESSEDEEEETLDELRTQLSDMMKSK